MCSPCWDFVRRRVPGSSRRPLWRAFLRVYYFSREGSVQDISDLDPGAEDDAESGWGGLTEFSGHVGDVVAGVAARNQAVGGS